jgi:hypothetical protein
METKIPEILNSYETGEPFTNCIDCDRYLLDGKVTYLIEKAIRQYHQEGYTAKDTIFEYAMCLDCAEHIKADMSNASRLAMESYMSQNSNVNAFGNEDLRCIIKGNALDKYEEYQIFSLCQGNNMLTPQPIAIGADALEELSELISPETKDEFNRLMGDFFGAPPELEELFPKHRVPFLI